jgi:HSP20 family protein
MPRDIDRLQREIEELFSDLWQVPRFTGHRRGFRPAVDVFRSDDPPELRVVVELAGVKPETIQLATSGRALVIAGERPRLADQPSRSPASPSPRHGGGGTYQQLEIEYGRFQRTLQLPADVETAKATAAYEHGMLAIVLPIATSPPAPQTVPIEVRAR